MRYNIIHITQQKNANRVPLIKHYYTFHNDTTLFFVMFTNIFLLFMEAICVEKN
jgi:hypothetical protein